LATAQLLQLKAHALPRAVHGSHTPAEVLLMRQRVMHSLDLAVLGMAILVRELIQDPMDLALEATAFPQNGIN